MEWAFVPCNFAWALPGRCGVTAFATRTPYGFSYVIIRIRMMIIMMITIMIIMMGALHPVGLLTGLI